MEVEESSPFRAEHELKTYRFCSEHCRQKFVRNPSEFTKTKHGEKEPPKTSATAGSEKQRQEGRGSKWTDYIPLIVIIALTVISACAKQVEYGGWHWMSWMHDFMGFFLLVFSMFKFFNIEGFADGFRMYDLLAKPVRYYAYLYPFIELGLGLGYLSHWHPAWIYTATVIVMVFGSLGVINALRKGLDLECACMGTVLKVPLSTVALLEDLGMAVMAGTMLIFSR